MSGIAALYAGHARQRGDAPALVFDDLVLNWRDLAALVDDLAGGIAARTPARGKVALVLPQSPAQALFFLACARAGREAQILDASWPTALRDDVLQRLAPDLVLGTAPPATITFADPHDIAALRTALEGPNATLTEADADALFYCGLTSGSTGAPRAYRRTHRSWLESFRADRLEFGIRADDVVLAPGSLTHSLFVYALAHGLHVGATVVMCTRFHPPDVLRLARHHRASVLYSVPSQAQLLADSARLRGEPPLGSLQWLLVTGAKWFSRDDPALRRLFPGARFVEFYGASETSFITLARDDERVPQGSVGRAFDGVRITIRDEAHRALATGKAGRVFIESGMLFHSYAGAMDDAIERAGDAICVGDVGYLDDDGFLFLTGRAKRMIVTAGKNLYPEEVEAVLRRHPAIAEAAVIGVADALRGERLVALVNLRAGALAPTRRDLIAFARTHLPLYKVPRRYARIAGWPYTHSAKSDFQALEDCLREGRVEELR